MRWAALCLGFLGLVVQGSSLAHATTAARLGVSDPSSRRRDGGSRRHYCYTSEFHGSDLHSYHPCLVSRNSLGTTDRPPISYSGCLDIFSMCGCPFKVRSIHIFGAMNGLVAMGMGGWVACRIGLGCVACTTGGCQC